MRFRPKLVAFNILQALIAFGILAILPLFLPLTFCTNIILHFLLAISLNVMFGYGGLIPLGIAQFFGFGAYGFAWSFLATENLLLAIICAIGFSIVTSAFIGICALRKRDPFFMFVVFGFNIFFYQLFSGPLAPWTGSDVGISVPNLRKLGTPINIYYILVSVASIAFLLSIIFIKSKLGALLIASSESEEKLSSLGYNVFTIKFISFIFCSLLAGLSGALFVLFNCWVGLETMSPFFNVNILFMVLIGGAGTIWGPLIGCFINDSLFYTLTRILRSNATIYLEAAVGVGLLAVIFGFRRGIYPYLHNIFSKKKEVIGPIR